MLITSCREKQTRFLQVVSDDTLFLHAAATALSLGGLLVEPAALAVLHARLQAFDARTSGSCMGRPTATTGPPVDTTIGNRSLTYFQKQISYGTIPSRFIVLK
jgi:hypothetical protein